MQQHPMMQPHLGTYPQHNVTTEIIQKYLDENKQLILAILDNQNHGKMNECAAYQAKLQANLMYLAAIADAQPQPVPVPVPQQLPSTGVMMPGGVNYLAHQHAQQQQALMASHNPLHYSHSSMHQQQQTMAAYHAFNAGGANGLSGMHSGPSVGVTNITTPPTTTTTNNATNNSSK